MIHRPRPIPDGTTIYIEDEQRLLEYVDGEWVPVLEERADAPSVVDVLRAHEWTRRGCTCGWAQERTLERLRRSAARTNHPIHVAHMLRYRSLIYPPAAEFISERPR